MEERRNEILRELDRKGKVKVTDLSREFGCSEVTIRNDIKAMDIEGLLKRTHGGAVKLETAETESGRYSTESLYRNVAQKKQIAEMAYDFLEDRDTIIIDDASTSFYLAREIRNHPEKRIAVVTNSLITGNELAGVGHVELFMIGGYVTGHLAATMGDVAIQNMSKFHVDKAFIGVHSINFNVGLTSIATPQMEVKKAIMKAAEKVYVLADSSKFGGGYLSVICPTNEVYKIIRDNALDVNVDVCIIGVSEEESFNALKIAQDLRMNNINVVINEKVNSKFNILLDDENLNKGIITIKDNYTSEEINLDEADVIEYILGNI